MTHSLSLANEIAATGQPIRPGEPGVRPFWNNFSYRFVYAPAFSFTEVPGAVIYRFSAILGDGRTLTFTADEPWAPLTPVWGRIPHGKVQLVVQGLNQEGEPLAVAGERVFYRAPIFNGPYNEPAPRTYKAAGKAGLRALFQQRKFQYWLTHGEPDPECKLYCYPSKEMGAAVRGMVAFSKIADDPQEAKDALRIARTIADFLIDTRYPQGSPMEYLPLVYWINPLTEIIQHAQTAANRIQTVMLSEPTRAAFAFLDLYDATNEEKYLEAALRMARTYAKIRRADGTWPVVVHRDTGEELESKPMVPTWLLFFLDRLHKQYGIQEFEQTRAETERWILDHPVKGFHWDAQFEDIKIKEPYQKMSYEQAADMAGFFFDNHDGQRERVDLGEELLRFVEDQFVVWERPNDGWKEMELAGSKPGKYPTRLIEYWITPAVIEQYGFFIVARATAWGLRTFGKAYEATGNEVYLAKARSLANTLVVSQQHHGGGEIPTFPMTTENFYWTNNSVYTALYLLELDELITRTAHK